MYENIIFLSSIIFAISTLGGLIGSMVGLGGTVIITPILVIYLGVDIHYAMGAALVAIICTSTSSSLVSLKNHGFTKEKIGLFLAVATTFGAFWGSKISVNTNPNDLSLFYAISLITMALLSLSKKGDYNIDTKETSKLAYSLQLNDSFILNGKTLHYKVYNIISGFIAMIGAGFLAGLLGIGAGAYKVIGMDKIMKIPFKVSTSTSSFIMGMTVITSVPIFYKSGYIEPMIAMPVALGTILGANIGSRLIPKVPSQYLRMLFFITVFIASFEMFIKSFS